MKDIVFSIEEVFQRYKGNWILARVVSRAENGKVETITVMESAKSKLKILNSLERCKGLEMDLILLPYNRGKSKPTPEEAAIILRNYYRY